MSTDSESLMNNDLGVLLVLIPGVGDRGFGLEVDGASPECINMIDILDTRILGRMRDRSSFAF